MSDKQVLSCFSSVGLALSFQLWMLCGFVCVCVYNNMEKGLVRCRGMGINELTLCCFPHISSPPWSLDAHMLLPEILNILTK